MIGQVHPHTAPARAVLETEGLQYQGYVDIFDGGPTLEPTPTKCGRCAIAASESGY
nr:arginine N-succinyltransferase [Yersinia enterocolitica]